MSVDVDCPIERATLEAVLDPIRVLLLTDGIVLELVEVTAHDATVRLTGLCRGGGPLTMYTGLTQLLRREIDDFGELCLEFVAREGERTASKAVPQLVRSASLATQSRSSTPSSELLIFKAPL